MLQQTEKTRNIYIVFENEKCNKNLQKYMAPCATRKSSRRAWLYLFRVLPLPFGKICDFGKHMYCRCKTAGNIREASVAEPSNALIGPTSSLNSCKLQRTRVSVGVIENVFVFEPSLPSGVTRPRARAVAKLWRSVRVASVKTF